MGLVGNLTRSQFGTSTRFWKSGQRSFKYFRHMIWVVFISRIPFHCRHTSLTFHSEMSSKYEKIDINTSTGSEVIFISDLSKFCGTERSSMYWESSLGGAGLGRRIGKLSLTKTTSSSEGSLFSSPGISSAGKSRSWPVFSSRSCCSLSAAVNGGSSFPESSLSDSSVANSCSSLGFVG